MEIEEFISELHQARAKDNEEEPQTEDLELLRRRIIRPLEQGHLNLSKLRLGVNSSIALAKGLKKHELFSLDLSNNMIGDIGCVAIMQLAQMNSSLTYLNVESNDIGDEGSISIGHMLQSNQSIETLLLGSMSDALHGNNIGPTGAKCILKGLESNLTIARLGFNRNPIFVSGTTGSSASASSASQSGGIDMEIAESLVNIINTHETLHDVELGTTGMTTRAAMRLLTALKENSSVTHLDISGNKDLQFGAFDALSKTLMTNMALSTLILDGVPLGARGADELSSALAVNRTLQTLSMRDCAVEEYGIHAIASALVRGKSNGVLPVLTSLSISGCGCGPVGCAALAVLLKNPLAALQSLSMENNPVGQGAASIAEALRTNTTLTFLNLSQCKIEGAGATDLLSAVSVNHTLTTLHLDGNFIPEQCGPSFVSSLSPNTTILTLTITGSLLSRQVVTDLAAICKRNRQSKKNAHPMRMKDEIAHLLRELGHLPQIMHDYRHTERLCIRVDKEIRKVEKAIAEVKSASDELTAQLKMQRTEQEKQLAKKQAERDEKVRDLEEALEQNKKQHTELTAALEHEEDLLKRETTERQVMCEEDIRSLYFTYEVEKEKRDNLVQTNDAEIKTIKARGERFVAQIAAKGGKIAPAKPVNRPLPR
ncbi:putative NLR family CARD domain-containing protein 3 [Monocercomonoides exilis]|uniref:putative NLR family CARD domain-containing protein 3 n=1 Tax=Monocercomonoides exilis TaxID=2049356 RepID=UPI003559FF14|nr:putative NLR family CARD domain-containing protein 3 [Monocercomonoides exilis]|eukprot:MONOS_3688.1-p1 / transcript=MONOS_3688.1 / gene=MONOS_3688 / organism=Monocercomonoides_exilis_PA203 / gene_product=ribonuclease inhibitor-like protein / transcript_product=ribonuclease inhibitor-like protein / location=Mono_scaffold00089:107961-110641(-) / protein_length=654 / sequence_SO=supercontig / SO=protein_coding / is_pseudo=false